MFGINSTEVRNKVSMLGNDTVAVGFPCRNRPQFLWVGKSPKVVQTNTQDTSGRVGEEAFICIRGGRGIICKRSRYFWLHVPGSVPARHLGELWPFRHSAKSKGRGIGGGGGERERAVSVRIIHIAAIVLSIIGCPFAGLPACIFTFPALAHVFRWC